MKRFGIELEDRMYNKDEVRELLQKVTEGILKEDLIKLNHEIKNIIQYENENFISLSKSGGRIH